MATEILTSNIEPPHEVREAEKLAVLVASMQATGWTGRPLLVIALDGYHQALTGSHRLAAAEAAGLVTVPCIVVEMTDDLADALSTEAGWDARRERASDPQSLTGALLACGLDEAAALLDAEETA